MNIKAKIDYLNKKKENESKDGKDVVLVNFTFDAHGYMCAVGVYKADNGKYCVEDFNMCDLAIVDENITALFGNK